MKYFFIHTDLHPLNSTFHLKKLYLIFGIQNNGSQENC